MDWTEEDYLQRENETSWDFEARWKKMRESERLAVVNAELLAKVDRYAAHLSDLLKVCEAARHALRSYQYANDAGFLAEEIADACEAVITRVKGGA